MLKKLLLVTLAALLCPNISWAQYVAPETGKAYRILNAHKNYQGMVANYKENIIEVMEKSNNAYEQMWILEKAGTNSVYIKNGLTGKYIQSANDFSELFKMGDTPKELFISKNPTDNKFYNIKCSENTNRGLHASPYLEVVVWYSPSLNEQIEASEWVFEDAGVSLDVLAEQQENFRKQQDIINNTDKYNTTLAEIFTDLSCSELNATYASMSDSELLEATKELPEVIQNMALKIKNNTWGKREKEFRVREYKPYADVDEWSKILQANQYSYLSNPTGIYGNAHEQLYIFVEGEIKDGAFLGIEEVLGTNVNGITDTLKVGLNVVPISFDQSTIFVRYEVNTHNSGKKLADYPNLKIHIENGTVNGFFEKGVHTDADWRDITQNLATHPVIQVKGERVLYHMEKKWITADNCCKNTITDAIGWWDNMLKWDHELLGWDKGIYGEKFNNLHCAVTRDDDHTYQASTAYHTLYGVRYIYKLLPFETVQSNHDNVWGPGHELGHTHQKSIQVLGSTEFSCNLFANLTMYKMGIYTSRGDTLGTLVNDFAEQKAWTSMLGESKMRMWWQLYLYFHMAGHDTEFYPKLFALLREDGIDTSPTHVQGNKDILHFAEKCCEAANMDLTDFFRVWGFFRPIHQRTDKEAAQKDLTITQAMIDKTLAKMASYGRKAPAIEFIEDRIEPISRTDGNSGNKQKSDYGVGECGDVGQYTYYVAGNIPEATGYSYTKIGKDIIIEKGSGAVGFKVYNGKGEYKAMSNKLKFTIPEELAADPGIKIVAAEGDGDEVELAPYANNGEQAQKTALQYAMKATDYYVKYTNKSGEKVGYYYEHKLSRLKELKDSAQAAINNNDQSTHTFGEYLTLIDEELSKVYTSNSVIKVKPLNYYLLQPRNNTACTLNATSTKLLPLNGISKKNSNSWMFETDDDSLYRMKNKDGVYIASMPKDNNATVTTNANAAAKFRIVSLGNGYIYMEFDNVHGGCIGYKSPNNSVVGQKFTSQSSWWAIKVIEDNQTDYDTNLLDSTIAVADSIIEEILDVKELENNNYVINKNILIKNSNFIDLAKELVSENNSAISVFENDAAEDYGIAAEKLQKAINSITAAYTVIPQYPSSDTNDGITWYYIKDTESNKYLSVELSAKRYLNYVMHATTSKDEADDYMLWTFIPTGKENEYYIFNAGSGCALFGASNIEAMGGSEALPYTLQLDTANTAFTIGNNGKYIYGISTYPKMNNKANYYHLEKADKSDIALLAPTNGERYGRKPYGKTITNNSSIFAADKKNIAFIDLKEYSDAASIIENCKNTLGESNAVYYTSLSAESAATAGSNVVDKNNICKVMNINNQSAYYIPEGFTAENITYTDENTAAEDIRPIILPFVPTNKITTAAPYKYEKVDNENTLILTYTEYTKNTPMFAIAGGESIKATATNVIIDASSKEDITTDYLLISYVGTSHKTNTYVQAGGKKYQKSTQAGTLAPFEMNIKALPESTNSATAIYLAYDETTGIEAIESDEENKDIYDLTGRKIEKITKSGIYIIGKKKVIIRNIEQ
ncbi:MAG: hypothetical protein E7089_10195 [Bacteroidales bacterium]|nr:hypothetical protein [Bacteroidales bacterium]